MNQQAFEWIVGSVCAYEAISIFSKKCPSVTKITNIYPYVGAIVLGGLAEHFRRGL